MGSPAARSSMAHAPGFGLSQARRRSIPSQPLRFHEDESRAETWQQLQDRSTAEAWQCLQDTIVMLFAIRSKALLQMRALISWVIGAIRVARGSMPVGSGAQ